MMLRLFRYCEDAGYIYMPLSLLNDDPGLSIPMEVVN